MPDRATVFQNVRIAKEATPGTFATTGFKQLQSIGFTPAVKVEINTFGAMGTKFDSVAAVGKEWTEAGIEGYPTYDELVYPLSAVLEEATITTPGSGVISRQWAFSPSHTAADTLNYFTIEQGDSTTRIHRTAYNTGVALTLGFTRAETSLSGSLIGQRISDNVSFGTLATATNEVQTITITGTPTGGTFTLTFDGQTTAPIAYDAAAAVVDSALEALSTIGTGNVTGGGGALPGTPVTVTFASALAAQNVSLITADSTGLTGGSSPTVTVTNTTQGMPAGGLPLVPIIPSQVSVYLADSGAGLTSATALTRALSAEWSIDNRQGPIWALNAANTSWVAPVELKPGATAKLKLAADTTGMGLLTTMRAGSTKFMRIQAVGPTIEGAITNKLTIDTALKVTDVSEFSDEDGLYAIEWTFGWVYDSTWGKATNVEVINSTLAL